MGKMDVIMYNADPDSRAVVNIERVGRFTWLVV
jgi:hypothetical protein